MAHTLHQNFFTRFVQSFVMSDIVLECLSFRLFVLYFVFNEFLEESISQD